MLSRPTTTQLLDDCAREVRESILPQTDDPAMRVNLEMLEQVLAACALRAGHEIAWMAAECEQMESVAADVVEALPDARATSEALAAYRAGRDDSLHLDACVTRYHLASEALASAIDDAMAADDKALVAKAVELVHARRDRETELRPNFAFPGRA